MESILAGLLSSLLALSASLSGMSVSASTTQAVTNAVEQVRTMQSGTDTTWRDWRSARPVISDIEPEAGPTGTTVTLTGRRFADDSIVRFGRGMITDTTVSADGRTLSFVVPDAVGRYCAPNRFCTAIAYDVEPGEYNIRIQNGFRLSNTVQFEVEEGVDGDDELAISGITGPAALRVGAVGTWDIEVDHEDDGNLQYSVRWGDEGVMTLSRAQVAALQSQASFTHSYGTPGTYHPEFTVTDSDGNTVTKVADPVVVLAEAVPLITTISPESGLVQSLVTLSGSGFSASSTVKIGQVAGENVVVKSDSEITFVVPALAKGVHAVTVTDADGTSNTVHFEVTGTSGKVSISGLNAPTRLEVDEEGTWTVLAKTSTSGNLQYTVDWGEATMSTLARSSALVQASASFTHSYSLPGTYKPKFTVTDAQGNVATVGATVVVESD